MNRYKLLVSFVIAVLLFLVLFGTGVFWFGGINPFITFFKGESIAIFPKVFDLGACEADAETVAVFKMTNLSSKEISVVGGRTSCDCAMPEGLPIFIAPGKTVDLNVKVYLPKYESSYNQTVIFMVAESDKLSMYPVQITATIPNPLPPPVDETATVTI